MRPRFSLRLLILLMAAASLFLGYSQIRRKRILETAEQLQAEGLVFNVTTEWMDYIWQRVPLVAFVNEDGTVSVNAKNWDKLWNNSKKKASLVEAGFIRFANAEVEQDALGISPD